MEVPLYAELVRGRVENVQPDLKAAYKRTIMMNISRLKYYGEKWLKWVRKNTHTGNKSDIPERHQQKRVISDKTDMASTRSTRYSTMNIGD